MMASRFTARVHSVSSALALWILLVTTGTPLHAAVPAAQNAASGGQQKATIALTTDPSPAQKGTNTVHVKLTDAAGQPLAGAEVTVSFFMPAMPDMNMAAMKTVIKATDKGAGMYEGTGDLGSGGVWQVTVTARQNGKTIATRKLTVRATGGM